MSKKTPHDDPGTIPQPAPRVDQDGIPHEPTDQLGAEVPAAQPREVKRGHLQGLLGKVDGYVEHLDRVHAQLDDSAVMDRIHATVVALNTLRETVAALLKGAHPGGKPGEQPPLEEVLPAEGDADATP